MSKIWNWFFDMTEWKVFVVISNSSVCLRAPFTCISLSLIFMFRFLNSHLSVLFLCCVCRPAAKCTLWTLELQNNQNVSGQWAGIFILTKQLFLLSITELPFAFEKLNYGAQNNNFFSRFELRKRMSFSCFHNALDGSLPLCFKTKYSSLRCRREGFENSK